MILIANTYAHPCLDIKKLLNYFPKVLSRKRKSLECGRTKWHYSTYIIPIATACPLSLISGQKKQVNRPWKGYKNNNDFTIPPHITELFYDF